MRSFNKSHTEWSPNGPHSNLVKRKWLWQVCYGLCSHRRGFSSPLYFPICIFITLNPWWSWYTGQGHFTSVSFLQFHDIVKSVHCWQKFFPKHFVSHDTYVYKIACLSFFEHLIIIFWLFNTRVLSQKHFHKCSFLPCLDISLSKPLLRHRVTIMMIFPTNFSLSIWYQSLLFWFNRKLQRWQKCFC